MEYAIETFAKIIHIYIRMIMNDTYIFISNVLLIKQQPRENNYLTLSAKELKLLRYHI